MYIEGELTKTTIERINVSGKELINALIRMCGVPEDTYYRNDKFVTSEDISHHGSPYYEYTEYKPKEGYEEVLHNVLNLKALMEEKHII